MATLCACAPTDSDVTPPPAADVQRTTVSGLSAGGYMAVQVHIALSDRITGAASLAGGPYHCAEGSLATALGRCMRGSDIDVAALADVVRQRAEAGDVAPLSNLADARVWLFHSPADAVIGADVASASQDLYQVLAPDSDIAYVNDITAAHGWPTLAAGSPCEEQGGDFINACNYDAAGALLAHLYGPLEPPAGETPALQSIDISALLPGGSQIASEALAMVPPTCSNNPGRCRLHLSFHGCRQSTEFIEQRFARDTGLNRWAVTNNIAIVYPQVTRSAGNPQGCWDWWGYTGQDYDQRSGKQVAAIAALIDAFENGTLF